MTGDWWRRRWPGPALVAAALAGIIVTLVSPVPAPLPAVALGSVAVLHALRALAFFLPLLIAIVVIARGFGGELPTQLSDRGLGYAGEQVKADAQEGIDNLSEAVLMDRLLLEDVEERVRTLETSSRDGVAQYPPSRKR